MTAHDGQHDVRPYSVTTLLVVRDDETGWAHVAHDIDPRRRPRCAGLIQIDSESTLVTALSVAGFQMAAAYRVDEFATAFLFGRAAAREGSPPQLTAGRPTALSSASAS
ncbi:hypothetical protein PV458_31235 [Streptomyces sp. MN03-5084-2B]|nr:hypothetical protein [Streptomyces sp. MN03-5084-2B]